MGKIGKLKVTSRRKCKGIDIANGSITLSKMVGEGNIAVVLYCKKKWQKWEK